MPVTGKPGRRFYVRIFKSGDLPGVGTETLVSDHEELVVPFVMQIFYAELLMMESFCFGGRILFLFLHNTV